MQSMSHSKAEVRWDAPLCIIDLDVMNARLMELERAVFGERTYKPRKTVELPVSGVTFVDEKTGVAEYFGSTSTIDLLRSFHKAFGQAHTNGADERASKRRRQDTNEHPIGSDIPRNFRPQEIYTSLTLRWGTRQWPMEDRHETNAFLFFRYVYNTVPILDKKVFCNTYKDFGEKPETPQSLELECLTYSVLALGALYPRRTIPNAGEKYFAEAQCLLANLLGASSLKTVQAALLMAVYAHYTARHNLAYDYLGIAIRLAYSAGLNRNFDQAGFTNTAVQEARRTWWVLYSLESELCLEYGRPLCIRETDSTAPYPEETLDETANFSRISFVIVMAKFSRTVRKVIDLVSNIDEKRNEIESFVGRLMNLQAELMTWKGELPAHLANKDPVRGDAIGYDAIGWVRRQCRDIDLRE
ncbi:hypothetical protein N7508_001531 [Penicillium antarcticum]|uniref:uncharacterized protein n=1 Tax=Penicillium antarcticum TaxID=416450 RepID=UPI0023936727|nr:uncharacterized protein N7508_001531 [Penicillium antarcticum]KAJ5317023.1 hypothetical protein N7508_001531 [Penicillium antarcticum]